MTFWQWVGVAVGGLFALGFVSAAISEYTENKDRLKKKFKEELLAAIMYSQPTWQQVIEIADTSQMPMAAVHQMVREFYKAILIGGAKDLLQHKDLIEEYIASHKRAEPFEGLPNEIRIHLERLSDALGKETHLLDPLTNEVRELVTVYKADYKLQKRYTSWGFFLGLVGLAFAAYSYFYPYIKTTH